jgi:hypothetical protein
MCRNLDKSGKIWNFHKKSGFVLVNSGKSSLKFPQKPRFLRIWENSREIPKTSGKSGISRK